MTSEADRRLVVGEFEAATYPGGVPSLETAWLGVYQVLLWYASPLLDIKAIAAGGPPRVQDAVDLIESWLQSTNDAPPLHIREANDLKKKVWRSRAGVAETFIAEALGVSVMELPGLLDRMMQLPRWARMQRNNPLGNGLRILVAEILGRWGNPGLDFQEETKATRWFPGIQLPGRSRTPSIDVAVTQLDQPRAVVSCKWSIRHDRISDPTNECQEYKAAAVRRQMVGFRYFVVTNELDGQRLDKILNQPCVDGLVHIHLPLVRRITGETSLMKQAAANGKLMDLAEFVESTHGWT